MKEEEINADRVTKLNGCPTVQFLLLEQLSLPQSIYLSIYLPLLISPSIYLLYLSLVCSISPFICLFIYRTLSSSLLYLFLSKDVSPSTSMSRSIYHSLHPPPSIYLSPPPSLSLSLPSSISAFIPLHLSLPSSPSLHRSLYISLPSSIPPFIPLSFSFPLYISYIIHLCLNISSTSL